MSEFSLDARANMTTEHRGGVPITLVTFNHPDADQPLLASSDRTTRLQIDPYMLGTISRGQAYPWVPMSIARPDDKADASPEIRINIAAIDRSIFDVIRASREPATCKIELVWSFSPNLVEQTLDYLEVVTAPFIESSVSIVLGQESYWSEPFPAGRFTPTYFPGLHR